MDWQKCSGIKRSYLANSSKMYTKITPYNESPVSATFNLNGLSNALKPLQAACNWK